MKHMIALICAVSFFVAASARADWSTTRPSMKVAIVPFAVQGDAGHEWIGRALQEGLATGLRKVSGVIVAGIAPADAPGATYMAKNTAADAVIFGSIQIVGDSIRVTGQIISMQTGESLGSIRSDGAERDLFSMEDVLSARVERILAPPPPSRGAAGPAATLDIQGPTVPPGPSRYFDGNLMSQLNPPDRYRDQYDQYYYYTADTAAGGYCCGSWGYGGAGCGGAFGGGPYWSGYPVIATPVSGW